MNNERESMNGVRRLFDAADAAGMMLFSKVRMRAYAVVWFMRSVGASTCVLLLLCCGGMFVRVCCLLCVW